MVFTTKLADWRGGPRYEGHFRAAGFKRFLEIHLLNGVLKDKETESSEIKNWSLIWDRRVYN